MTKDLKRTQLKARLEALAYNWWGIYTQIGTGPTHREAITTRQALMEGVAQQEGTRANSQDDEEEECAWKRAAKFELFKRNQQLFAEFLGRCGAVGSDRSVSGHVAANPLKVL
jgi:hypothetical protein